MTSHWECSIRWRRVTHSLILAVAIVIVNPAKGFAQLNGQNIKGDAGLKSGSQAPPGTYVAVPLYFYTADEIKNRDGNQVRSGSRDAAVFGVALNVVTTKKIAGGTYGFLVALPWARAGSERLRFKPRRGSDRHVPSAPQSRLAQAPGRLHGRVRFVSAHRPLSGRR